jgi:hypothetical protein
MHQIIPVLWPVEEDIQGPIPAHNATVSFLPKVPRGKSPNGCGSLLAEQGCSVTATLGLNADCRCGSLPRAVDSGL